MSSAKTGWTGARFVIGACAEGVAAAAALVTDEGGVGEAGTRAERGAAALSGGVAIGACAAADFGAGTGKGTGAGFSVATEGAADESGGESRTRLDARGKGGTDAVGAEADGGAGAVTAGGLPRSAGSGDGAACNVFDGTDFVGGSTAATTTLDAGGPSVLKFIHTRAAEAATTTASPNTKSGLPRLRRRGTWRTLINSGCSSPTPPCRLSRSFSI